MTERGRPGADTYRQRHAMSTPLSPATIGVGEDQVGAGIEGVGQRRRVLLDGGRVQHRLAPVEQPGRGRVDHAFPVSGQEDRQRWASQNATAKSTASSSWRIWVRSCWSRPNIAKDCAPK